MKIRISNIIAFLMMAGASSILAGCEKYLDNTALPAGTIAGTEAYVSDNSVSAIVTGSLLALNSSGPASFPELTSLYADELLTMPNTASNNVIHQAYANDISPATINYWTPTYSKIYALNLAIEGINTTPAALYFKNSGWENVIFCAHIITIASLTCMVRWRCH